MRRLSDCLRFFTILAGFPTTTTNSMGNTERNTPKSFGPGIFLIWTKSGLRSCCTPAVFIRRKMLPVMRRLTLATMRIVWIWEGSALFLPRKRWLRNLAKKSLENCKKSLRKITAAGFGILLCIFDFLTATPPFFFFFRRRF